MRPPRGSARPPLALCRALLVAVWYDLSDLALAEAPDDRASFRRFCGCAAHEPVPERTGFVWFRKALPARGLDTVLFDEVTGQLRAEAVRVTIDRLVDATVIPSATEGDGEAAWAGHRSREAVHGYEAHVGADADTALIETVAVSSGFVGAVPSLRQPGKRTAGRAGIGPLGHARLRRALSAPKLGAVRHNDWLRPFYERLRAAGKSAKLAPAMRKLLCAIYSVARNRKPFTAATEQAREA